MLASAGFRLYPRDPGEHPAQPPLDPNPNPNPNPSPNPDPNPNPNPNPTGEHPAQPPLDPAVLLGTLTGDPYNLYCVQARPYPRFTDLRRMRTAAAGSAAAG